QGRMRGAAARPPAAGRPLPDGGRLPDGLRPGPRRAEAAGRDRRSGPAGVGIAGRLTWTLALRRDAHPVRNARSRVARKSLVPGFLAHGLAVLEQAPGVLVIEVLAIARERQLAFEAQHPVLERHLGLVCAPHRRVFRVRVGSAMLDGFAEGLRAPGIT